MRKKESESQLWRRILRPSCFGNRIAANSCVDDYFKRGEILCKDYDDCIHECLNRVPRDKWRTRSFGP